jgi:hypothetical protein
MPGRDQAQEVGLPGGEPGNGVAAPLGIEIGLVQVGAQQGEDRPVAVGEIRPGPRIRTAAWADRARAVRRRPAPVAA